MSPEGQLRCSRRELQSVLGGAISAWASRDKQLQLVSQTPHRGQIGVLDDWIGAVFGRHAHLKRGGGFREDV